MSSLRTYLLAALTVVLAACAIELPTRGAGSCGGTGDRCCLATEDAGAGLLANGCRADHVCVAAPMDAGAASRTICSRCPTGQGACNNRCVDLTNDTANCGACGATCPMGQICAPTSSGAGDAGVPSDVGRTDGGVPAIAACRCPGAGQIFCNNVCVNGQTDVNNCGACGVVCDRGTNCVGGRCSCAVAGQTFCAGRGCVNMQTDVNNCGGCNVACPPGQSCTNGMCSCPPGQTSCMGLGCVNAQTDPRACGMCGRACNPGEQCVGGRCGCPVAGQTFCMNAGTCVNLMSDGANCGTCDTRCPAGTNCIGGRCNCGITGQTFCPGVGCTNLQTDAMNCSACGVPCSPGQSCVGGRCNCPITGQSFCAGVGCTNLQTDINNCGMCGRMCNPGEVCRSGTCTCPLAGQSFCAAAGCVNRQTDPTNCGTCGNACPAGQVCRAGACVCPLSTQAFCGGACVDVTTSTAHCSGCGMNCDMAFANAFGVCTASRCGQSACRPNFGDCTAANGCETNTMSDPNNCGACNNRCRFQNAMGICSNSVCTLGPCNSGFADCNRDPADGCETNVTADTANCGMCGRICPATTGRTPTCTVVMGTPTCGLGAMCSPSNLADCDGNSSCETDTNTNANSCGGCGRACDRTNGTPTCSGGTCVRIDCTPGFGNCDGSVTTGCEVDFSSNTSHCGRCGNPCIFPNASATCVTGACRLGTCNAGFGNCDSNANNGCETGLLSDNLNCGACARACTGGTVCSGGNCVCPTGLTNCGGTCINVGGSDNANCGACGRACSGGQICSAGVCACPTGQTLCGGACTNRQSDNANCGACGNACPSGQRCSSGMCVTSCPGGTTDCTSVGAGCVATNTSVEHCGACGNACSNVGGTGSCMGGSCRITCASGLGNCDANVANGCEQALNTVTHCGACATACNASRIANGTVFTCATGACRVTDCASGFIPDAMGTACVRCGGMGQPVCNSPDPPCSVGFVPNPLTSNPQTCAPCGTDTNLACAAMPVCNTGLAACSATAGTPPVTFDVCYNLQTTADRCGTCTASCVGAPNSTGMCAAGKCACNAGFSDCDMNRANGCETMAATCP